jgi:hypothetical protein
MIVGLMTYKQILLRVSLLAQTTCSKFHWHHMSILEQSVVLILVM